MYQVKYKNNDEIYDIGTLCYDKNGNIIGLTDGKTFFDIDDVDFIDEITTTQIYPISPPAQPVEVVRPFKVGDRVKVDYKDHFDVDKIYTITRFNANSYVYFHECNQCAMESMIQHAY